MVAREVGIGLGTLDRWRGRLEAVIATAAMPEAGKSTWRREHPTMATKNPELPFMFVLSTLISIQWTFLQPNPLMSFQTVVW